MKKRLKHSTIDSQADQQPLVEDTPWIETEQSTLMEAFIYLTRNTEAKSGLRTHRDMTLDHSDNAAVRYLMRRLSLTMSQVQLLACILFHTQATGHACDMDDLTDYMNDHPLALYSKQEDLNYLVEAGYLEQSTDRIDNDAWIVRKEAREALGKNQPFDLNTLRAADATKLMEQFMHVIREGRHHDMDGEIDRQLRWLFKLNQHLPIMQVLWRIGGDDELVIKPLILIASMISAEGAICVDISDMNMILDGSDVRRVSKAMQEGKHPLVVQKIVEPFCSEEGLANADQWVISKEGWLQLLSQNMDEVNAIMNRQEANGTNLMPSSQIPERKLFFSGKTQENVNRLRQLLQDEQYKQVTARLKEKNMPTGINILLYGLPGTGKTELVQQLARETGRDIYMVDMSQIRDKYVGQSEQNLAQIFNTYRGYVLRRQKTPILFCNECDAIFGSRMERTAHAVDKMENTLQNILLEQMEKLHGIMICTTNLTSTLDKAFERRFLLKLQLPKPGNEARKQIWATMLPGLTDEQTTDLANRFDFSGGQIQNVTRKQIINSVFSGSDEMDFSRILDDCKAETMDRTNGRQIGFN